VNARCPSDPNPKTTISIIAVNFHPPFSFHVMEKNNRIIETNAITTLIPIKVNEPGWKNIQTNIPNVIIRHEKNNLVFIVFGFYLLIIRLD